MNKAPSFGVVLFLFRGGLHGSLYMGYDVGITIGGEAYG